MQLHELKRKNPNYKSAQVGRGKKRGKTSGRGTKGQKARAGHKIRPAIRDAIKKLPKMRGRGVNSNKSIADKPYLVKLDAISKAYNAGEVVNPKSLLEKKVISKVNGRIPRVKILSDGKIEKVVNIEGCKVSETAKNAIIKAGGSVK